MHTGNSIQKVSRHQRGAVLVISLIMLLLLTIIGVTAMRTVTIEERMAGNMRDRNLSVQAAESALRAGADWISGQASRPTPDSTGTAGVWTLGAAGSLEDPSFDWTAAGFEYGVLPGSATDSADLTGVIRDPRYVVEERYFFPDDSSPEALAKGVGWYYYQVTGGGFGGSDNTRTVLQATVANRYN